MTCGYPHVEDPHAVIEQSSYNIQRRQGAQIGDRAIVVCQAGYQMVINTSTASEAVHQVSVTCSLEGMWEKDHLYRCYNRSLLAQVVLVLFKMCKSAFHLDVDVAISGFVHQW